MKTNIKKIWENIYQEWFNLKKDFSGIQVPEDYDPEKHFAIIIAENITIKEIIMAIRKKGIDVRMKALREEELIKRLDFFMKNDRDAKNGNYIVLFKKDVEADEIFANYSAHTTKARGRCITLTERLLMGILYFDITGEHLDTNSHTACVGSYFSERGDYYSVGSYENRIHLYWNSPDDINYAMRPRFVQ